VTKLLYLKPHTNFAIIKLRGIAIKAATSNTGFKVDLHQLPRSSKSCSQTNWKMYNLFVLHRFKE